MAENDGENNNTTSDDTSSDNGHNTMVETKTETETQMSTMPLHGFDQRQHDATHKSKQTETKYNIHPITNNPQPKKRNIYPNTMENLMRYLATNCYSCYN